MKKKILIVEDQAEMRDNIAELLSLSGYEVLEAPNGRKGAELAQATLPDLIVCDIMMPELDGYGMLYIVNKNPQTAQIPFIFLTAKTEKEDFRKGMTLGADDYLTKPFDELDLLSAIETRLKKPTTPNSESNQQSWSMKDISQLKIWEQAKQISLGKKEFLFHIGEELHWVYFIEEGIAKELKTNRLGKEYITRLHRAGSLLALDQAFEHGESTSAVVALSSLKLKAVPQGEFLDQARLQPGLGSKLMRCLAQEVRTSQEKLIQMAYESVRKRLAETFAYLHDFFEPENHLIALTREDIANLTGTTVETAIRTISQFKKEELIELSDRGILVTDLARLKNIKH